MVELSAIDDSTFRRCFVGYTFNTAWYLRRPLPTGWHIYYLTAVGDDAMSGRILDSMRSAR